jgi:hypothetical protein
MKLPIKYPYGNLKWITNIPKNLFFIGLYLVAPLKAIVYILDAIVAGSIVALLFTIYAWWTHKISDAQVAWFAEEVGNRVMEILHQAHIY